MQALQKHTRIGFFIWTIFVLVVLAAFIFQLAVGVRIETNILALLPPTEQNQVVDTSLKQFSENVGKRSIFLLSHPVIEKAYEAADILGEELEASKLFRKVVYKVDADTEKSLYETFFPFRYHILSESLTKLVNSALSDENGIDDFLKARAAVLYSPISGFFSALLERDPFLLFAEIAQNIPRPSAAFEIAQGKILVRYENVPYVMVVALAKGNPFSQRDAENISQAVSQARAVIYERSPGIIFRESGVYRFALASAKQAESEASTVGTGSLLGVILLMLFAFRSVRQIVLGSVSVLVGVVLAFVVCQLVFDGIHVITLAFGASLIGVAIDYSFHFFADQLYLKGVEPGSITLRKIFRGISFGLITSLMAYAGLALAPFPGLRQMALFSSVGILGAFGSVVFWYPVLSPGMPRKKHTFPCVLARYFLDIWRDFFAPKRWKYLMGALALIGVFFSILVRVNDDVRLLQTLPEDLVAEEGFIRGVSGGVDPSRFFVIEGATADEVLERESELRLDLDELVVAKEMSGYQAISKVLPSTNVQQKNMSNIYNLLTQHRGKVFGHLLALGFRPEAIEKVYGELARLKAEKPLEVDTLLEQPFAEAWQYLWLGKIRDEARSSGYSYVSIVLLENVQNEKALQALEDEEFGVHYLNKVEDVSTLLHRYRVKAVKFVALAYFAIFLVLYIRYGFRRAILVISPPLIAATISVAVLYLFAIPINLFSVLGLMLVLGIGIDFTIFFAESGETFHERASRRGEATMLAILLSSMTTILSFGLLSLSATAALQSFGLVVLTGILVATLLSPVVLCVSGEREG